MQHREYQEQCTFVEWAILHERKYPELELLYASANGEKRDIRAAARLKKSGVKAGIPDLHLPVARGEYHSLYIEMKYGKNKLTSKQEERKAKLEKEGNAVAVCYSCEEAISVVSEYLILHRLP